MRNSSLVFVLALGGVGLAACNGKRLHAGDDGAGGGGQSGTGAFAGNGGHAGAVAGAGGSILPSGTAGMTGAGGTGGGAGGASGTGGVSGTGGAGGAASSGGAGAAAGTGGSGGAIGSGGAGGAAAIGGSGGTISSGGIGGTIGSGGAAGQTGPGLRLLAGALGGPGYADGTGAAARFNYPIRIASDGAGNIYVAEQNNYTIRKVAVATGAVTTLAGRPHESGIQDGTGTAAGFSDLKGIASDGAGNLFVADAHTIRKVVIATGAVTTLTDDTTAAILIDAPTGIAADGAGYLYVADSHRDVYGVIHSAVRKVAIATGAVFTIADRTGVSVQFDDWLYDVASDGAGNLYIANGNVIEKVVVATGAVTTIAGMPGAMGSVDGTGAAARFGSPSGLAADGAGNLFIADGDINTGNTIRQVVVATGAVTTIAGKAGVGGTQDGIGAAAGFGFPVGIASDRAGNLFVADIWENTIRKVVVATGEVTTLAGAVEQSERMDGTGAAARFGTPEGIASDGAGNLYVVDHYGDAIRKVVVATGAVTTLAGGTYGSVDGTGAAASFYLPSGIAADGAGNLFVTDTSNNTIRKIVIATGAVTTLAGTAALFPGSKDGTGAAASFNFPLGIASDGAGNLFVTDGDSIRKIVIATRAVTTLAGSFDLTGSVNATGTAARFTGPIGVTTDGTGNLFVADTGNSTIRKIVIATRAVTTFAGVAGSAGAVDGAGASARFSGPVSIASDGAGNLFVGDGNGTVRKIAIASAIVSTVIGSPGRMGVSTGALPAAINVPWGLTVLPTGELAIADSVENSILIGHF